MFYLPGVLKGLDGRWARKAVLSAIRTLDGESAIDVIDAHFGYPEGVGCTMAAARLGLPVFITMRGLERQVLEHRWRASQLVQGFNRCDGIICVSRSLQEIAVGQGVDPRKIRVIPNAVEREVFHPGPRDKSQPASASVSINAWSSPSGCSCTAKASTCSWRPSPGCGRSTRDCGWPSSAAGRRARISGADRPADRRARDRGLHRLPGPQPPERVADWLRAADLFALPTYDKGGCNAVLEALACGLPVVTTDVGDNATRVAPPRRGLLVPRGDAGALAEAINAGLGRTWDRDEIARHDADYTWEEVARRTAFSSENVSVWPVARITDRIHDAWAIGHNVSWIPGRSMQPA